MVETGDNCICRSGKLQNQAYYLISGQALIRQIRLLTNNPKKVVGLDGYGLRIVEQVPIQIPPNQKNRNYLKTKREKLGHLLDEME